jgi:enediyne biosynthesis protein E8
MSEHVMSPPARRPRLAPTGEAAVLTGPQTATLEAFADTVIPGRKRFAGDTPIAGVSATPGAVEAGALKVLCDPATGMHDGVGAMAELLDERAVEWARTQADIDYQVTCFVSLAYEHRRRLVAALTSTDEVERDAWFLLALFANMAYDSAPHLETVDALASPVSGLRAMGFRAPVGGQRWRFDQFTYGRPLARLREGTDARGNLP